MSFQIIYDNPDIYNVINILRYINDFTKKLGIPNVQIEEHTLQGVVACMQRDFPHAAGLKNASPFKKAANFAVYFIAENPIQSQFPREIIGDELASVPRHQNAILAFEIARDILHGATLHREDDENVTLENKIELSTHSYIDIVCSLCDVTPQMHFKIVSVLFEQLVYRFNPHASYDLKL